MARLSIDIAAHVLAQADKFLCFKFVLHEMSSVSSPPSKRRRLTPTVSECTDIGQHALSPHCAPTEIDSPSFAPTEIQHSPSPSVDAGDALLNLLVADTPVPVATDPETFDSQLTDNEDPCGMPSSSSCIAEPQIAPLHWSRTSDFIQTVNDWLASVSSRAGYGGSLWHTAPRLSLIHI